MLHLAALLILVVVLAGMSVTGSFYASCGRQPGSETVIFTPEQAAAGGGR